MQSLEQLTEVWRRLDGRARMIVILAACLCVGGLIAFTRLHSAAAYAPLYTGLAAEDAGQIVEKLKEQKVPYRLSDGGNVVLVPEDKVYEMRIELAKEGLPASGQVGLEIFDRSGLPGTQFSNQVNYQRALQGELCRTIGAMKEVASARVHLVLPEENLFSEKTRASASVVLIPRSGAEITPEMTAAIAHIVASAVQGVQAQDVTVVDNAGRVLRGPETAGKIGGMSAGQFEIQQQYEDRLCMRLQSMLDSVLGANLSVVRVQAQLDFDAEEVKNENLTPLAGGKGLLTSEKIREEQYSGSGGSSGGSSSGSSGGSVGAQANLGLGMTTAGGGRAGSYVNRDETREYQFSRSSTSLVKAPGKLKSLAVAAIIDDSLAAAAENQVREVLSAAAGIDRQRGDVVTIQRMKIEAAAFAKTQEAQAAAAEKAERTQRLLQTALRSGLSLAAAALIFMSLLMVVRQLRQSQPAQPRPAVAAGAPATARGEAAASSLQAQPLHLADEATRAAMPVSEELNLNMRDQLRDLTREDTPAVVDRILELLQEEPA